MVHVLLKPGLENFEHYFTSMWDECNCVVFWAFFGVAFLWDWNENWPILVLWPLLSFPNWWHIECNALTASSFRIWNSSTGIPSPPLALFIMMLPKAHLTLHSRDRKIHKWYLCPSISSVKHMAWNWIISSLLHLFPNSCKKLLGMKDNFKLCEQTGIN